MSQRDWYCNHTYTCKNEQNTNKSVLTYETMCLAFHTPTNYTLQAKMEKCQAVPPAFKSQLLQVIFFHLKQKELKIKLKRGHLKL